MGSIAAVSCFLVLISVLIFPDLRNYRYIQLAVFVAINNFLGSVGIALGAQRDGSFGCAFQAITTNANYLSAIFWTNVIAYQFYILVFRGGMIPDHQMRWIHVVCWGIPIFLTLIPLTMLDFGNSDDEESWCYYAMRGNSSRFKTSTLLIWKIFSFYLWVWLSAGVSVYLLTITNYRIRTMEVVPNEVLTTRARLMWYPIITMVCWLPATLVDCFGVVDWGTVINYLSNILAIVPGFFLSVVFFVQNPKVVRQVQLRAWYTCGCCLSGDTGRDSYNTEFSTVQPQSKRPAAALSVDYTGPRAPDPFKYPAPEANMSNMVHNAMYANGGLYPISESELRPTDAVALAVGTAGGTVYGGGAGDNRIDRMSDGFSFAVRDSSGAAGQLPSMCQAPLESDDSSFQ